MGSEYTLLIFETILTARPRFSSPHQRYLVSVLDIIDHQTGFRVVECWWWTILEDIGLLCRARPMKPWVELIHEIKGGPLTETVLYSCTELC